MSARGRVNSGVGLLLIHARLKISKNTLSGELHAGSSLNILATLTRSAHLSMEWFRLIAGKRAFVERFRGGAAQQLIGQDCSIACLSRLNDSMLAEGYMLAACQFGRYTASP